MKGGIITEFFLSHQSQILEYIANLSGLNPSAKLPLYDGYSIAIGNTKIPKRFLNHNSLLLLPVIFFGKSNNQKSLISSLSHICNTLPYTKTNLHNDSFEIVDISVGAYPSLIESEPNGMFIWSCTLNILYYSKHF